MLNHDNDIILVEAKMGLTNYYHNPVIRTNAINLDPALIDELASENLSGGISGSTLLKSSVYSSGLNAQGSDFANIAGGFADEYKGICMLKFKVGGSQITEEYLTVIGYVTNNSATDGVSQDALFTPAFSWKTHEKLTSGWSLEQPTQISRQIGARTDYLINDGSSPKGLVSLRPNDIIDYSTSVLAQDDIANRMEEEGVDGYVPTDVVVGKAAIDRVGVVGSKRSNINPSSYAKDIIGSAAGVQRNINMVSGHQDANGDERNGPNDGLFNELSNASYRLTNNEPDILRDEFFSTMGSMLGISSMRKMSGFTIGDILFVFPNLNEVLDLILMNKMMYESVDFTLSTEGFGTSKEEEIVSQEITLNILELMMRYGLTSISFKGSNCDTFGEGNGNSNIVIIPYNPASMEDDDYQLGNKVASFVDDLTNQIFTKLNGLRIQSLVPIRFDVQAELFGTCTLGMVRVNETNIAALAEPMPVRAFPTFATCSFTSMIGTQNSAIELGSNYHTNLKEYFSVG